MCPKKSQGNMAASFFIPVKKLQTAPTPKISNFLQLKFTYLHDNSADRLSSSGEVEIYSGKSHFELVMLKIFEDFDEKILK